MFDLGWSELFVIGLVALLVIGPKDLPQAIRTVTQMIRKLRGMAREFQSSLDDLAREAGVDEIKRDLTQFREDYDPRAALENIENAEKGGSGKFDETTDPTTGNSIAAPATDERPVPPDLTPADFGAAESQATPPDDAPPAAPPTAPAEFAETPARDKKNGGAA